MPSATRNKNCVEFLMDGEEIYVAMRKGFQAVAAAARGTAHTHVRLAFWIVEAEIGLGMASDYANPANKLTKLCQNVIDKGHNVDIILWYPNAKDRCGIEEQGREHNALAKAIRELDRRAARDSKKGKVRLYKERYEGPIGASQHQKLAIFTIDGQRSVVIGGANLAKRYMDTTAHNTRVGKTSKFASWHETAMLVRGPITDDIDLDWERRWKKVVAIAEKTLPTKFISHHLYCRGTTPSDAALTPSPKNAQNTYPLTPNPAPTIANTTQVQANVPAFVRFTRSETTLGYGAEADRVREIRDELVERIGNARQRIYMENCQLTDPELVQALYKTMIAKPNLKVVIVTNPNHGGMGYLGRRAWLHMALRHRSCTGFDYTSSSGGTREMRTTEELAQQLKQPWTVVDKFNPGRPTSSRWLQDCHVKIKKATGGKPLTSDMKSKVFEKIVDVKTNFHFYAPVRLYKGSKGHAIRDLCVHSKLAVIDDMLICGSANYTYRSMQYDGEIMMFMNHAATANHALERLIGHYETAPVGPHGALTLDNISKVARQRVDDLLDDPDGVRNKAQLSKFQMIPLEYRSAELKSKYKISNTMSEPGERPIAGHRQRVSHPQKTSTKLAKDGANWTWL